MRTGSDDVMMLNPDVLDQTVAVLHSVEACRIAHYGWAGRVFRCQTRQLEYQPDGAVLMVITAKQEDSSVYTDLVTADYTTGTSSTSAIQLEAPEAPTGLTATAYGGQNIRFDWSLGSFWLQNGIVELWEAAHSAAFGSASLIWSGRGTTAVISRNDTTTRDYWVRIRTIAGKFSATDPASSGLAAAAGTVGTGNITPNASYDASSTDVAGPTSIVDNTTPFNVFTVIASISIGSYADATQHVVTVSGNADMTNNAFTATSLKIALYDNTHTYVMPDQFVLANQVVSQGTLRGPFSFERMFSIPASTAVTWNVAGLVTGDSHGGISGNVSGVHMKVEVLKR
jgi:hypothetical protein